MLFAIFELGRLTSSNVTFLLVFQQHLLDLLKQPFVNKSQRLRDVLMYRAFADPEHRRGGSDRCSVVDQIFRKNHASGSALPIGYHHNLFPLSRNENNPVSFYVRC